MKTIKKNLGFIFSLLLTVLAFITGASANVLMANASPLPDAGKTEGGAETTGGIDGIATETFGRTEGGDNFYLSDTTRPNQPLCQVKQQRFIRG